jgi:hypothetical protein
LVGLTEVVMRVMLVAPRRRRRDRRRDPRPNDRGDRNDRYQAEPAMVNVIGELMRRY